MTSAATELSAPLPFPAAAPRRQNAGDRAFFLGLGGAALVAPATLVLFLAVLVWGAWPSIGRFGIAFLFTNAWQPMAGREQYGAGAFLLGTLISSVLALALAAPVGIGVATFLNEVLSARLRSVFRFFVEILATVPSVVYGLWGIFVLAPWVTRTLAPGLKQALGFLPFFSGEIEPRNMLCAVLILAIMVLPMIMSVALEAMRAVPASYREAALGLGATRWEMIRIAVWPAARAGISGGCILALGRALGETMAVTMVIGNGHRISASLFAASDTVASTIANQFAESPTDLFTAALIELALLLFILTLVVNLIARLIVSRLAGRLEVVR